MTWYRIQSAERNVADLLDPAQQVSLSYCTDTERAGVSVCDTREDLAAYIATSGIPFDGTWVLVEVDGYYSDDEDEDADAIGSPSLVHPTSIVSVEPIADGFEDEIFAAFDAAA